MALQNPTTGIPLTLIQAKRVLIKTRVTKRARPENNGSVDEEAFTLVSKGVNKFNLPPCTPGHEFMLLDMAPYTPVVISLTIS
jgi:hypothetical protein